MVVLHTLIRLYIYVLILNAVLSWFPVRTIGGPLDRMKDGLRSATEPVLAPIRQLLPRNSMGIDFSVWVAILALQIINAFI